MNPLFLELGKAAIPLLPKLIKAKKDDGNTPKNFASDAVNSTGLTGLGQGGLISALYLIYMDLNQCGGFVLSALQCVTNDHWGILCGAITLLILRARSKVNEGIEND